MSLMLLFPWTLAVLTAAPASPAPSTPSAGARLSVPFSSLPSPSAGASPPPLPTPISQSIHDISPPIDVFPYPLWMVVTAIAIGVIVLGLIIWWIVAWIRRRPAPPPPSPWTIALRELEKLRTRARETEPYLFSVAVSDVLRTFISDAKFRLPATKQTSPEFLAAISGSPMFTEGDRTLLGHFLEKCDLIKFARVQATSADNSELVESAMAFVQGGRS
jgi:hypothetical protein